MVDKFNVTAGTTVSAEIGEQTAGTTRTYYGVINALPGVTADAQNDDIQQTRPSVNGTHFADQNVFIDGVDTTFAKFGGSRVYLPTTAVTEVSMEAGGASAEYGRAVGSSTNVIVKSGTNKFHADALIQEQKVDWGSEYIDQPSLAQREVNPYPTDWFKRTEDEKKGGSTGYEFSAGGPIKKDKAWFFIGLSDFDDNFQERLLGGDPYDASLLNEARIFKFNFQPKTAHSFAASFIETPTFRNYFNQQSFDYWTPTPHGNDSELWTVNYNWSISSKLFLETKIAFQETQENKFLACNSIVIQECLDLKAQDRGPEAGHSALDTSNPSELPLRFPSDASRGALFPGNNYNVYTDRENLGAWHNGWILSDGFGFNAFPRDQANAGLTQFIGANHEIKWGLDYQSTKWEGDAQRTSFLVGSNYDSYNDFGYVGAGTVGIDTCSLNRTATSAVPGVGCSFVDYNAQVLQDIKGSGNAEMVDTAFFVRDRFTAGDHWTFNVGVRGEIQEGYNDVRRKVVDASYVDPRINVTYDIKGDGKMLFNLSAGRYHAMLNQAWIAGGVTRPAACTMAGTDTKATRYISSAILRMLVSSTSSASASVTATRTTRPTARTVSVSPSPGASWCRDGCGSRSMRHFRALDRSVLQRGVHRRLGMAVGSQLGGGRQVHRLAHEGHDVFEHSARSAGSKHLLDGQLQESDVDRRST